MRCALVSALPCMWFAYENNLRTEFFSFHASEDDKNSCVECANVVVHFSHLVDAHSRSLSLNVCIIINIFAMCHRHRSLLVAHRLVWCFGCSTLDEERGGEFKVPRLSDCQQLHLTVSNCVDFLVALSFVFISFRFFLRSHISFTSSSRN